MDTMSTGKLKGRKMAKKWYTTETDLKAYFSQEDPQEEPLQGS